jgi:hypothetical protein
VDRARGVAVFIGGVIDCAAGVDDRSGEVK